MEVQSVRSRKKDTHTTLILEKLAYEVIISIHFLQEDRQKVSNCRSKIASIHHSSQFFYPSKIWVKTNI